MRTSNPEVIKLTFAFKTILTRLYLPFILLKSHTPPTASRDPRHNICINCAVTSACQRDHNYFKNIV